MEGEENIGNTKAQALQGIRKVSAGIKRAIKRTSFENKDDFRQFFLASDISQTRIVIVLLALVIALFAISDYMLLGLSLTFYVLAALRLGLVVYSGFIIRHIGRVKNYRSYDTSIFIYLLVVVFGVLMVNITRPQNFLPHIIVIDMAVFVFYLVIPTRFVYQALPSIVFSMGEFIIITLSFETFQMPSMLTALFSLAFANIVAALSSLQVHSYRWRIFEHVTERKETERLVAIGQTAGMIGHDIRNPLQAIVNELYLAKEAIAFTPHLEDKKGALESINLIEEQAEYISKIIMDLQDYARPIKPEFSEVDMSELVISVFNTVRVPQKIVVKIDFKGLPKIRTDPTLIRRALTNLINNAIQAMPSGGRLELTAGVYENKAVITVSDTGEGIPEEVKPRLFTPLVSTKAKGQGLGLAVVKRLVEALDGSITFESEQGKGTTFRIEFPLKSA